MTITEKLEQAIKSYEESYYRRPNCIYLGDAEYQDYLKSPKMECIHGCFYMFDDIPVIKTEEISHLYIGHMVNYA